MIQQIRNPDPNRWPELMLRPTEKKHEIEQVVKDILRDVKDRGDIALKKYSKKFDNLELNSFKVSGEELNAVSIDRDLQQAIELAKQNIEQFHRAQLKTEEVVETSSGVKCWRKNVGIERVGLYIPGGSAPLFSTLLMLGIPAKLAGCRDIVVCSPPNADGSLDHTILYTARLLGLQQVYKVGGAQAVAAMAYGTKSVPRVYKIFGPGNQFVTKAKELVQQEGLAIDMPAGPSELLIIADKSCNPAFIAADLLSQAEHGADSQVFLLCTSETVVEKVITEVSRQLEVLPRRKLAERALHNSKAIVLPSLQKCMEWSNLYAPEHLIISTNKNEELADQVINAGSVFLGKYSCESAGDYASGTNHTLPTNGFARAYSGVSTDSFMKKITFQELTARGLTNIGPAIEKMAEVEGLHAHKNAVTLRLNAIKNV